jgi:DMSO/TMAO reductase YedYZ heme-binding membrane subunit
MSLDLKALLKNKAINKWRLFWLISIPMSITMVAAMMRSDMSTASGISSMIGFSVRWAVPFIYLVVAASSVQILFPGTFSKWWLRNRKYIGMCFAVAMAWQGLFIFIMSYFFRDYYFENVYLFRDELEGSIGYIFLPAMVVTSFEFGRKHLSSKQWKLLHKSGIYFLWAYPFSTYWWSLCNGLSCYGNPVPHDYVYYWGGFLAFALRIAAWGKQRTQAINRNASESSTPLAFKALGGAIIAFGLFVSAYGLYWQERVTGFLTAPKWSADLELWLPFWPYEPFLSLFIIGLGTMLVTMAVPKVKGLRTIET